jgi:NAD(P)-dependent dehydrogenase (short-subunit alcohol dehydrogenase family)
VSIVTQNLTGKTLVITGASSGIGAVAARRLAQRGATVVPVGRSSATTAAIAADVGTEPLIADYARLADVRALAKQLLERYPTIDVLAHNAGGMLGERRLTEDGHELTMQVNYFAPFLLQHLLHDRLSRSGAHIVVTSSVAHRGGRIDLDDLDFTNGRYSGSSAYNASKLADLLIAREIARRTPQTGITAVAFHPGNVRSGVGREASGMMSLIYITPIGRPLLIDAEKGAAPLVHLASLADPHSVNGQYFNKLKPNAATSKRARDAELGRALWERTETLLGLHAAQ